MPADEMSWHAVASKIKKETYESLLWKEQQ